MKKRDLRILWNSNAPFAGSGYSIATRDILYRLAKDGWPVAISAFYGLDGGTADIAYPDNLNPDLKGVKIKHYPRMGEPYGSDSMYWHGINWKANAIFCMQDIWTLNPNFLSKFNVWIPYFPVDKKPIPLNVLDKLRYAYKIICFSKFGYDLVRDAGFYSTLIYEGTDTKIFKPEDKVEARKALGIPQDIFLFSMVAANKENPPRKGFQEAIDAFKLFSDKHKEAAMFFQIQQRAPTGFPIKEYANYLGISNRMYFLDDYRSQYAPDSSLINKVYNSTDVLLHPSQTEGFGLTLIEAQACGVPVVIQNSHSMPELIQEGKTGFGADTLYERFTPDMSFVNTADYKSVYKCMEKAYVMAKTNPEKVRKDCRKWIVDNFDIDTIVKEKWIPFLTDLQEELLTDNQKGVSIKSPEQQ
jgi:glycosyltransferase involved in cell wall biosynthesis